MRSSSLIKDRTFIPCTGSTVLVTEPLGKSLNLFLLTSIWGTSQLRLISPFTGNVPLSRDQVPARHIGTLRLSCIHPKVSDLNPSYLCASQGVFNWWWQEGSIFSIVRERQAFSGHCHVREATPWEEAMNPALKEKQSQSADSLWVLLVFSMFQGQLGLPMVVEDAPITGLIFLFEHELVGVWFLWLAVRTFLLSLFINVYYREGFRKIFMWWIKIMGCCHDCVPLKI